jgi:OmpA-OmpF porin, OOP family
MQFAKVAVGVVFFAGVAAVWQPVLADEGGWYVGLGGGRSQSRLDDERLARELSAPGFIPDTVSWDNHGDAYKGFAGYQFFKYFALEGSYFDLGKFSFVAPTSPSGSLDGKLRVHGIGFDAVGILPFTEKFSAFVKLGANYARTFDSFSAAAANTVANPSPREWATNPKVGGGLQYAFAPHFALRGEWERYRIADGVSDHGNIDAWFVSIVFPFGHHPEQIPPPPAPAAVVEAPAPVVAEAPPPPVTPPPPRRVRFSADALFAFDSAMIRPEGTGELDKFASQLRGTTYDQIHVLGYADRIGSEAYNLRLSQQRADAVKAFLVGTAGVEAGKITSEGRGKSDPVTKPGECGAKRSAATIACLQPDRRVEIEVSGTQR